MNSYDAVLIIGIYCAFLSWAVLQERIATTPYGQDGRIFRAVVVLNTCQSVAASLTAYTYIIVFGNRQEAHRRRLSIGEIYPSIKLFSQYMIIAVSASLAAPFGYASLRYLDYPTMILGKSSKLLSVMAVHLTLYRASFPPIKYLVAGMVTAGVVLFTLAHPSSSTKSSSSSSTSLYGLLLLFINLLLDGFTNSTQDVMFRQNPSVTGPHMMLGFNLAASLLTATYLFLLACWSPHASEVSQAYAFVSSHPDIIQDIVAFAFCGAIGQIFIFMTLERMGSLILVTVTLTRKIGTMLLSFIWFGHHLSLLQWPGVALVFGGIGIETWWTQKAKRPLKEEKEKPILI